MPQFANEHVLHPGVLNDIPARKSQDVGCFFFLSPSLSLFLFCARMSSPASRVISAFVLAQAEDIFLIKTRRGVGAFKANSVARVRL